MRATSEDHGQVAYDLEEFCKDYGHPTDRLFTVEITCNSVTCVYANVLGTVRACKVISDLDEDLLRTRQAH
jgi:hypothetical protein